MTLEISNFIVALSSLGTLIVAVATFFLVRVVKVDINSRMTALLELTEKASKAEGLKQGREETK